MQLTISKLCFISIFKHLILIGLARVAQQKLTMSEVYICMGGSPIIPNSLLSGYL